MRIAFLVVLLGGAVFYSYLAFADLGFMTRTGRLGPGFFPRIIGVAMICMLVWAIWDDRRVQRGRGAGFEQWSDAVLLVGLALCYAVLLRLFGGFVASVAFLAVALPLLNRGKHVTNALVAVLVPSFIYLLFDRFLNANMPPALIPLPI